MISEKKEMFIVREVLQLQLKIIAAVTLYIKCGSNSPVLY